MSRRALIAGGVVLALVAFVVGRPLGDDLLETVSGDSPTGAVLVGLAHVLPPLALGVAWLLPRNRQLRAGAHESDLRSPEWLGTAFWVSFAPMLVFPLLVSRSGPDTPLEESGLFGWFLLGLFGSMVPALLAMWFLGTRRKLALAEGARIRQERYALAAATAPGKQTPDKVRRKRRRR